MLDAFARAIDTTFLVAVPIMAVAFVLALFVPELPLRRTHSMEDDLAADAGVPVPTSD